MAVELVTIGNEVLTGRTLDTNAAFLARALEAAGVSVGWQSTVGDDAIRIAAALSTALGRAEAVVMTGGLGPTADDLTRDAVARALGVELVVNARALDQIRERLRRMNRPVTPLVEAMARVPAGAETWPNPVGTAPGIHIEKDGKPIILLPGVPGEMEAIASAHVVPFLKQRAGRAIESFTLRTAGAYETLLEEAIGNLPAGWEGATLAFLPSGHGVDLRVTVKGDDAARVHEVSRRAYEQLRARVGGVVYAEGERGLEEIVGDALLARGWRLATAESCTGGLLAKRLTDTPGSSRYFERGFVTYSNASKVALLGVPEAEIAAHGAVSAEVAEAMARGARERAGVELALGITGIAGPDGGTAEKPVGTVFISVASPEGSASRRLLLVGPRRAVRERSAQAALEMGRRRLAGLALEPRLG